MSYNSNAFFTDDTYNALTDAIFSVIKGAAYADPAADIADALKTLEELFRLRSLARCSETLAAHVETLAARVQD